MLKVKEDILFSLSVKLLPAYLLVGVGGYILNDLFDQKSDKLVKKFNFTLILNQYFLSLIIIIVWCIGFYLINSISKKASYFLIIQYVLLLVYSIPPFRFKEKGILGILTDACYAHVIPEIILLIIIQTYVDIHPLLWMSFLFFTFSIGMRDILIHQLESLKEDSMSKTNTYAINNPQQANKYRKYLDYISFGAIISFFLCFFYIKYSVVSLYLLLTLIISYIYVIIKNKGLIRDLLIRNYIVTTSIYFTYLLIVHKNALGFLFLIHPYFISFIKTILSLLKSIFNFFIVTAIPLLVNYILYYIFLILGRNLKEKPLYKKNKITISEEKGNK